MSLPDDPQAICELHPHARIDRSVGARRRTGYDGAVGRSSVALSLGVTLVLALLGCESATEAACVVGSSVACSCDGSRGVSVCGADGTMAPCVCDDSSTACIPGRSIACVCPDGVPSIAVCDPTETFAPCMCARDGGMADATLPDAAQPPCNPYTGATCGCGEPIPPLMPTLSPAPPTGVLGSGPESLVDVLVGEGGIVVVLRDDMRLLSRTGEVLGQWHSEREILAAVRVGARIVAVDRAQITWLEGDLTERGHFAPVETCLHPLAASCDRLLCATLAPIDWSQRTYDLASGAELFHGTLPQGDGTPAAAIPGADAFLTAPWGYSPSNFWYHRVLSDGTLELVSEAPYWGELYTTPTFAFVGWPATHLVTQTGQRMRLDTCFTATSDELGSCMHLDTSVAGFGGDDTVAMDGARDGTLASVRATPRDYFFDPPCVRGCRLERIDVTGGRRLSSHPITFAAGGYEVRVRHDAWSGRAVVSTPHACEPDYPNPCEGWEVRLEAY